jgi:hypothetical protein
MNTWVEPPPRKGLGCFAKGCLILLVFAVVLAIACGAGIYWGFKHHSALVRGIYWLTRMHMIADSPAAIPHYEGPDAEIQAVKERWQDFETAARARQPAEVALTANEINDLIASNPDTRGKMFVSIEGNRLLLQMSIPLGEFIGRSGYYFNGDITIQFDGAESLVRPRLTGITINNQPLPSDILDWKFRSRPLRDYLTENEDTSDVSTAEIRDDKLILRSRGE